MVKIKLVQGFMFTTIGDGPEGNTDTYSLKPGSVLEAENKWFPEERKCKKCGRTHLFCYIASGRMIFYPCEAREI